MKTARKTNEQALNAFISHKSRIDELLARIQALSDDNFNVDLNAIHWVHVGELEHYQQQLKEITDCAFREGEYAD